MNENQWKASLVRRFKNTHPDGFVQSFEARFKSGFPDLMFISKGKVIFMELKKLKILPKTEESFWKCFKPIQLEVMKQIINSRINATAVVRSNKLVSIGNAGTEFVSRLSLEDFEKFIENI